MKKILYFFVIFSLLLMSFYIMPVEKSMASNKITISATVLEYLSFHSIFAQNSFDSCQNFLKDSEINSNGKDGYFINFVSKSIQKNIIINERSCKENDSNVKDAQIGSSLITVAALLK